MLTLTSILKYHLWLCLILLPLTTNAQSIPGKLVLVGGGSEDYNDWSDAPYQWAIDQSTNKRVAIITYDNNPSQWMPNYFKNLGAVDAKNFSIPNQNTANLRATYDSLVSYDVIFLKGGDQKQYYQYYKGTLTQDAVEDVFQSGGVICGTSAGEMILSKVFFSAENGTVYPEEAIEDPNNQYMTLKDDFLELLPGYVFDSHVVERGRFARMIGFMGNWKLNHDEDVVAIGVDDKTAFCIDSDLTGYAFGTGAVSIYRAKPGNDFRVSGVKLLANELETIQILNECTINLNTFEISGFEQYFSGNGQGENFNGHVLFSASDGLNDNLQFLEYFGDAVVRDSVLIVTGNNTSTAQQFKNKLEEYGTKTEIMQAIEANQNDTYWGGKVERLGKFLFINNNYQQLMSFLFDGTTGEILRSKLVHFSFVGTKAVGFVGGDARFAGGYVLVNYDQEYASYDGLLDFNVGIGLLANTLIMANAFENSDIIENAAAGVPYGMLEQNLNYGIWLHGNSFAEYWVGSGETTNLTSFGDYPVMVIRNDGSQGGFSDQSAVNSGNPRDVAGFDNMLTSLIDETVVYEMGELTSTSFTMPGHSLCVYPNPSAGLVAFSATSYPLVIEIFSIDCQRILKKEIIDNSPVKLDMLSSGTYSLQIFDPSEATIENQKLIIIKK